MALEVVSVERRWFQFDNDPLSAAHHPVEAMRVANGESLEIGFDFSILSDGTTMGDCVAHFRNLGRSSLS